MRPPSAMSDALRLTDAWDRPSPVMAAHPHLPGAKDRPVGHPSGEPRRTDPNGDFFNDQRFQDFARCCSSAARSASGRIRTRSILPLSAASPGVFRRRHAPGCQEASRQARQTQGCRLTHDGLVCGGGGNHGGVKNRHGNGHGNGHGGNRH